MKYLFFCTIIPMLNELFRRNPLENEELQKQFFRMFVNCILGLSSDPSSGFETIIDFTIEPFQFLLVEDENNLSCDCFVLDVSLQRLRFGENEYFFSYRYKLGLLLSIKIQKFLDHSKICLFIHQILIKLKIRKCDTM